MARLRVRRPRRSTVVFVEAVLAVVAAAVAVRSGAGTWWPGWRRWSGSRCWCGTAAAGCWTWLRDRLRDPADRRRPGRRRPEAPGDLEGDGIAAAARAARPRAGGRPDAGPARRRRAPPGTERGLGVVGDGQGFAAVLGRDRQRGPDLGVSPTWSACSPTTRPARPRCSCWSSRAGPAGRRVDPEFAPGPTYRSLPVRGLPLWNRVLLVIRHEPAWAPETVAARGGGATGARNAVAAVAARAVAPAARDGLRLRALGAAEVAGCCASWATRRPAASVGPHGDHHRRRPRTPRCRCRCGSGTPSARCCGPARSSTWTGRCCRWR